MAQNRLDREQTTREKTSPQEKVVKDQKFCRRLLLKTGYAFKWVRVSTQGQVDATNVSSKLREGWEPVTSRRSPRNYNGRR